MTDHEKSRNHYEKSGIYDPNMEHFEECEVNSGAWVLVTRQIPVDERCKPHLFGIYWGVPKQDRFDRQICVIHTTEEEEQATMTCNCTEAVEYQKEKQRKEKAMMNVYALFGENTAPDKRCGEGIVNILKAAVEEIYTGGLAKVTLNLRGGVKASISQNAKGEINVERTETKKQKLTE